MVNTASGLGIAVLWTAILISTVGFVTVIKYLKSKPLGCQTLLDPLLIDCYGTTIALIHFSGVILTLEMAECQVSPTVAWVIGYAFRFHIFLDQFGIIMVIIVNAVLVYSPASLEQIKENVLVISFRVTAIGLASLLIGLAYLLNEIPMAYAKLTREYELMESHNMIGIVLVVTTLLLIVAFKLSLAFNWNIINEGENSFYPVDVILGMVVLGRLVVILMTYYFTDIKPHNVKPFIIPSSGCFYSIGIICKKAALRNYVKRQLNIFYDRHLKSMADKMGLRSVRISAVHPTTKPVEALTTESV